MTAFNSNAQISLAPSPQDSLAFTDSVKTWQAIPPVLDSVADWQIATAVAVFRHQAAALNSLFQVKTEALNTIRRASEELYNAAKADSTITKDSLKSLKNAIAPAKKQEQIWLKPLKESNATTSLADKVVAMPAPDQRKNLPKLFKKVTDLQKTYDRLTAPPPLEPPVVVTPAPDTIALVVAEQPKTPESDTTFIEKSKKKKEKAPEKPKFSKYNPDTDVMLHPPQPPCVLAINRRDEFTGNVYREVQSGELFRFTNAVMKKVLPPSQPHILCRAALANDVSGGKLLLTFTIKDVNARRTFGGLPQKSLLSIKFMSGEIITLFNESTQEVKYDPELGEAVFTGQYPFQAGIFKKLEKLEIDQIRVAWSTGYEDYNIQQVGLLQHQSACLK